MFEKELVSKKEKERERENETGIMCVREGVREREKE